MTRRSAVLALFAAAACFEPAPAAETPRVPPASVYAFPPPPAQPAAAGGVLFTERLYAAALEWFDRAPAMVPQVQKAAEMAAERLARGGMLFVAGNPGFAEDMVFRAGGFPFAKNWAKPPLGANDVLLAGQFRANEPEFSFSMLRQLQNTPSTTGMVVLFNSHQWPQSRRLLQTLDETAWNGRLHCFDTGAPRGGGLTAMALAQMSPPALAWVFQGELFAAATRQGRTLAAYGSDHEPGGKEWNALVEGKHLHPALSLPPIPAGKLGAEYLAQCRRQTAEFARTQTGALRTGAARLAACIKRGGMVWLVTGGHIHTKGHFIPPGLDGIKYAGRDYQFPLIADSVPASDMVLWLGSAHYPKAEIEALRARGCDAVVLTPGDGPTDEHLLHIRGCWSEYDAAVSIANYPVRALPTLRRGHDAAMVRDAGRDTGGAGAVIPACSRILPKMPGPNRR